MGTSVGTIDLDLALQSDSFRKQLQQTVNRAVRNTNQQLGRVGSAGSALSGAFGKLGKVIAGAFAISKITAFGKECLSLGSDLAEVQNVVDVTFGGLSGSVDKFAKNAAKQFGLSETMAKKYAGTYGSMAEAFGFTQKQALDMSEALTGLTGDVASFYNISQDEAYTKIKSVFSGETETLKDLGVVMTQSALDAYALSKGFGKTTAEMSEAEKVSLRYAFVQEKLANAQGDYARTSDGWANSTRTLALQFDTLKAELGQGLINVFSPIVQWLNIIVERLTAAATKFKEFTAAIMGVSSDTSSGVGSTAASTEALNDSLSTTESNAKSAAKAMRDLMGFDEINRLSDKSDSTSSTPSAGQTPASTADNSNDKDKTNTLADSLQHIKKLWDDLYGSFKKGAYHTAECRQHVSGTGQHQAETRAYQGYTERDLHRQCSGQQCQENATADRRLLRLHGRQFPQHRGKSGQCSCHGHCYVSGTERGVPEKRNWHRFSSLPATSSAV